jgi:hypothetical protein
VLTKPIHFRIWQFKLFQKRLQDKWLYDRVTQATGKCRVLLASEEKTDWAGSVTDHLQN